MSKCQAEAMCQWLHMQGLLKLKEGGDDNGQRFLKEAEERQQSLSHGA